MTPPPSILARLFDSPWLRRPWLRRAIFAVALAGVGALTLVSRTHIARAELAPRLISGETNPTQAPGVRGAGDPAPGGGRFSTDALLSIARSQAVLADAADSLRQKGVGFDPSAVDIAALRGAIVQVSAQDRNPEVALLEATAFVSAIQHRLITLTHAQFADRRREVATRLADALQARATDPSAQARIHQVYDRYMEGISADEITADPGLDLIQPPYLDVRAGAADVRAEAAFALLALLTLLAELYAARPPVGRPP